MFRISRFKEILNPLPRHAFDTMVRKHQSDKYSKGFNSWSHLVAMLYAQFSGTCSLRTLEAGFNSQSHHHYHLGVDHLKRTTLADANSRRDPEVFADLARSLIGQVKRQARRQIQEGLHLLDSSSFTLKGRGFDAWTLDNRNRFTQGIKLHLLFDEGTASPLAYSFTPANVNDRDEAVKIKLESGAIYVFDKGYCDYTWWHDIDRVGAQFVTRFKGNAALKTLEKRPIPEADSDLILKDETVLFSNQHLRGGRKNPYRQPLRRVTVARPDHDRPLVLATNDLISPASVIAQRYKARWQIELFFKWIKQHLKIKTFLGRSEKAVKTQILTALIAYLLLLIHRLTTGSKTSLWLLFNELRSTLFSRPQIDSVLRQRRTELLQTFAQLQPSLFA
jgi:IS4 transposase